MMIILGIDPGLNRTGWGVISAQGNHIKYVACGVATSDPKQEMPERLLHLFNEIKKVVEKYKPDEAGIEETFVNKNALSSLKLGHARAAAMLAISLSNIPVAEYAAKSVKKAVVGVGKAEKEQVMAMIKHILPGANVGSEDAADALAVAICHCNYASAKHLISSAV